MVLTEAAGDAQGVIWDGAEFGHRPELSVRRTRLYILLFNAIFGAFSKSSLQSLSIADIYSLIDLIKPSLSTFTISTPNAADRHFFILNASTLSECNGSFLI